MVRCAGCYASRFILLYQWFIYLLICSSKSCVFYPLPGCYDNCVFQICICCLDIWMQKFHPSYWPILSWKHKGKLPFKFTKDKSVNSALKIFVVISEPLKLQLKFSPLLQITMRCFQQTGAKDTREKEKLIDQNKLTTNWLIK